MSNPLAASHELPATILAKSVTHTSMAARETCAVLHRREDDLALVSSKVPKGPDRHDEIGFRHSLPIEKGIERRRQNDLEAIF
jgi:hypothetical protein